MENLCRLCGSEDGIKVNIFEPGTQRVKKIHKLLPLTVNEHDPFPKQMCHRCSYKVDEFFEFRTKTIKTQEIFKRRLPWLKNMQPTWRNEDEPPMVEVTLNSVNAVSPNEKQISPPNGLVYDMNEDNDAIVIEDSPPYDEYSRETNTLASECELEEQQNPTVITKPKKSKSRSLWDTKKRKRKNKKSGRGNEFFDYEKHEDQNSNDIENDPLHLSPVDNVENNLYDNIVENNSCAVKSPNPELNGVEKRILIDDTGGINIELPKYILTTPIPRVGTIYTCERCGRTFLKPYPACQHMCPASLEEDRPKEDVQNNNEDNEKETTKEPKDFYQCSECGHVFTRHSQLVSHRKKHTIQVDSSSDDNIKPFNQRKKHHTKRKKQRLLKSNLNSSSTFEPIVNQNHFNSNSNSNSNFEPDYPNSSSLFEPDRPNSFLNFKTKNITRHALLSSDSE